MGTNKLVLRESNELMADFRPTYNSFMALFLGPNAKQYDNVVGVKNFKRMEAVGNIRNQKYNPKDTHVHQVVAVEKQKTFKPYFHASQFVQSTLQDRSQNEDVVKQVLNENNKLQDDLFLLGEGTSNSTMINNGLYWSDDANYLLQSSTELASTGGHLPALHASVVSQKIAADAVSGRKMVVFYGQTMLEKLSGINSSSSVPFRESLQKALGPNYSIVELPLEVTPSTSYGFIIVNMDQIKLHYTTPGAILDDQGVDSRNREAWHNFLVGSCMLEVLAYKGVIRQPHTFGA